MSRPVVERCAKDAREIDSARSRLITCQRQLDASAVLQEQIKALQAVQAAEAARHAREVAELERRPRWRTLVIVAGAGVLVGAAAWEAAR